MSLLRQKRVLGAKQESAVGVKETLTVTDAAWNCFDAKISPALNFEARKAQGQFGNLTSHHTGAIGKASFKTDLTYDGINIPLWATLLLPACGFTLTSRTFYPTPQAPNMAGATTKTLTIGLWTDNKYKCIYGAMGTAKIVLKTAQVPVIEWEFTGILDTETDVTLISPTWPVDTRLRCAGGPGTFNAVNLCMEQLTFDFGNNVVPILCNNKSSGYELFMVADRMPKATGNPESVLVASQNRLGMMLNGSTGPLRYVIPAPGYNSATNSKQVEILAPYAQLKKDEEGDREGVQIDDIEWDCNIDPATANRELSITFAA